MATKKQSKKSEEKPLKFPKVKKIKITHIDPAIHVQNGLFDEGCYGSDCDDICCQYGCDVDYQSYKLILKHSKKIERLTKAKIEDCFSTPLKPDDDYIDGGWRETAVNPKIERCMFHFPDKKGCTLFYLWKIKGLPKELVPTICKTYPITWNRGDLFVDRPLRSECKCLDATGGREVPSLYETQKIEVARVFDINPSLLKDSIKKGEKLREKKKKARSASAKKAAATRKKNASSKSTSKKVTAKKRARA